MGIGLVNLMVIILGAGNWTFVLSRSKLFPYQMSSCKGSDEHTLSSFTLITVWMVSSPTVASLVFLPLLCSMGFHRLLGICKIRNYTQCVSISFLQHVH